MTTSEARYVELLLLFDDALVIGLLEVPAPMTGNIDVLIISRWRPAIEYAYRCSEYICRYFFPHSRQPNGFLLECDLNQTTVSSPNKTNRATVNTDSIV